MGINEFYDRSTPECPYCGEDFENETAEGIHRSKEHISDDPIGDDQKNTDKNIINDFKRPEK